VYGKGLQEVETKESKVEYLEGDVVLLRTPGNRNFRFEVFNLRIRLDHDVLGNRSIVSFGKKAYEGHLLATRWIRLDLIMACGNLALGG
jgi:hypothetical protein